MLYFRNTHSQFLLNHQQRGKTPFKLIKDYMYVNVYIVCRAEDKRNYSK